MPCPATTAGSSTGWQNARPCSAANCLRRGHRLVERRPALDDRRPVGLARLDLGDRRAGRHEDVARDAEVAGGERHRLGVVAGAAGGDARLRPIAERGQLVHRAADLERPGPLQVLRLEHDRAAEALRQRRRRHDRGVLGDRAGDLAGGLDVGERDGLHRFPTLLALQRAPASVRRPSRWRPERSGAPVRSGRVAGERSVRAGRACVAGERQR